MFFLFSILSSNSAFCLYSDSLPAHDNIISTVLIMSLYVLNVQHKILDMCISKHYIR